MAINSNCELCSSVEETPLHLFKDCEMTKQIWEAILPHQVCPFFFQTDYDQWIMDNCLMESFVWERLPWNDVFFMICWWIWRQRNERLYTNNKMNLSIDFFRCQIRGIVKALNCDDHTTQTNNEILVHWKLPLEGWVALNTDGASQQGNNLAACGGVL